MGVRSRLVSTLAFIYRSAHARPLRIEFPGAVYHVMSHGDRREKVFDDNDDRKTFLAEVVERLNWLCHAC